MNEPAFSFEFTFTQAEAEEAVRLWRRVLHRDTRPVLTRLAILAVMVVLVGMFGFELAILAGNRLAPYRAMFVWACMLCGVTGSLAQRLAAWLQVRPLHTTFGRSLFAARTLVLDQTGAREVTVGREFGLLWAVPSRIARGPAVLLLVAATNEWLALPLRLLPDGTGALERSIAAWRTAA